MRRNAISFILDWQEVYLWEFLWESTWGSVRNYYIPGKDMNQSGTPFLALTAEW